MYILTADWQATNQNLAQLDQLVDLILEQRPRGVIHLGDVKESYNPVDQRVIIGLRRLFRRIKSVCPVLIVNGNHDRFSQTTDENFGPLLEDVVTEYVDEPRLVDFCDHRFAVLPWSTTDDKEKKFPSSVAALLAHREIHSARLDNGRRVDGGLKIGTRKFPFVFAGHIHRSQEVTPNVWYVGSPFPHTWSEINQRKYIFAFYPDRRKVRRIETGFSGRFDMTRPLGFTPKSWENAMVRVPNDGRAEQLIVADARKIYPGAIIEVVAAAGEKEDVDYRNSLTSDDQAITQFFATHKERTSLEAYVKHRLLEVSGSDIDRKPFSFVDIKARNVLTFKKVDFKFDKGITCVVGKNDDFRKCSNGAGKTNLFQLPAVLLAGKTRKGQTASQWKRRASSGQCWIEGRLKLGDGRILKVFRGRKPAGLRLWLDGNEITTGKTQKDVQRQLNELLGLNWESFLASVYIDQQAENIFLSGKPAERQQLLRRLLDLTRFDMALENVRQEVITTRSQLDSCTIRFQELEVQRKNAKASVRESRRHLSATLEQIKKLEAKLRQVIAPDRPNQDALNKIAAEIPPVERALKAANDLAAIDLGNTCGLCGQDISILAARKQKSHREAEVERLRKELRKKESAYKMAEKAFANEMDAYKTRLAKFVVKREREMAKREKIASLRGRADEIRNSISHHQEVDEERFQLLRQSVDDLRARLTFLTTASEAFQRSGVPAMLAAQIVPRLNRHLEKFAGVTDGEIKVQFRQQGDDVDVVVDNQHGGETLNAQSTGETQMISIMVSLAVRRALTRSTLLICDEPGHGLSEAHALRFTNLLNDMLTSFRSIMVATHNTHMANALNGRTVVVRKKGGVSCIL